MRSRAIAVTVAALAAGAFVPSQAKAASPERGSTLLTTPQRQMHAGASRDVKSLCVLPTLICAADDVAGGNVGDAATGVIGDVAGGAVAGAADGVMSGVVSWAADGAAWLVREVVRQIDRSSRPALSSAWFSRRYAGMTELAIALVALFLLLAIGQAVALQDFSRLIRAVFVALPSALLLTFAAITLVELALAVTDAMTAATLKGTGGNVRQAFHGLGELLTTPASPGLAPFVLFLSAVLTAVLALVVWLELVMREAAVYVAVAFLPLTLAGLVWERSSHWSRRLAEWLFAIVFAKFTIAASFAIAASAIADAPKGGGGLSALLAGCAVLAIAALTPLTLLRLLPFAEAAAGKSFSRGHATGAVGALPGAATATIAARQLALRNFGGRAGASATRTPAATAIEPGTSGPGTGRPDAPQPPRDLPRAKPPRRPPTANRRLDG